MSHRIIALDAIPVRLPRDLTAAQGTAGSPTALAGEGPYRWSTAYPVLYSTCFETAIIRVELEGGLVGWGEAQAPLVPEVACTIASMLLRPAVVGEPFDGTPDRIAELWQRMQSTMHVRGQSCGFMVIAMSGVDLALWDLAGKLAGRPVSQLINTGAGSTVPVYLSGTSGATPAARAAFAGRFAAEGITLVKLYYERDWAELLTIAEAVPAGMQFAVDALWHLPPAEAVAFGRELDARGCRWLECPLDPEDVAGHARLAAAIDTPLAVSESYRTVRETRPFFDIAGLLQPDLGRCGITGTLAIAEAFGGPIVPHVSIAMGTQIAAAIHAAAAVENCPLCEFNPNVLATANAFLQQPLVREGPVFRVPDRPGLGIEWNDRFAAVTAAGGAG